MTMQERAGRLSSREDTAGDAALVVDMGPGGELGLDDIELLVALDERREGEDREEDDDGEPTEEETEEETGEETAGEDEAEAAVEETAEVTSAALAV